MAKQKIETSIEINGIDVVAYPLVESDHVTFENGMSINEMIKGDVSTPVVTHEEISFKVGKGDSDVSSSIVDSSVGEMIIKGQTYQNILPEPSLRNSMNNGETMQKFNEGYDNVNVVDGVGKSAVLKGQTLVNVRKTTKMIAGGLPEIHLDTSLMKANTKYSVFVTGVPSDRKWAIVPYVAYTNNQNTTFVTSVSLETQIKFYISLGDVMTIEELKRVYITIVEGDIPLTTHFEGMKSVKSPSLVSVGKNLFGGEFLDITNYTNQTYSKINIYDVVGRTGNFTIKCTNQDINRKKIWFNLYKNDKEVNTQVAGTYVSTQYYNFELNDTDKFEFGLYCEGISKQEALNILANDLKFQIEEGSISTPFEPYKLNILTTPSDLTLRGIGDVYDTLDLVSREKVQNIGEYTLNGTEGWVEYGYHMDGLNDYMAAVCTIDQLNNKYGNSLSFSSNFRTSTWNNHVGKLKAECIWNHDPNKVGIKLLKTTANSVDEIKEYLKRNPIKFNYVLNESVTTKVDLSSSGNWEKVVLDGKESWRKDGQTTHNFKAQTVIPYTIKMISNHKNFKDWNEYNFANGYEISCHGGYIGTESNYTGSYFNLSIPKSKVASLEELKSHLSQNPITVWYQTTTHKDSTQVKQLLSFSNGHIQLSSEKGSLIPSLDYEVPTSNSYHLDLAKTSTQYTMKNMSETFTIDGTQYNASANSAFTTPTSMANKLMITSVVQSNVMLLEGDLTSKTIPYFKGIKSAFEGEDEIEILSVGKNLFDVNGGIIGDRTTLIQNNAISTKPKDSNVVFTIDNKNSMTFSYSIAKRENVVYVGAVLFKVLHDDGTETNIHEKAGITTITFSKPVKSIKLVNWCNGEFIIENIQLEQGTQATPYQPYKSNITKIPLSSPLRSLPNGVRDEVILDRENNKVKVIQRVGHEMFDGSENWQRDSFNFANRNFLRFITFLTNVKTNGKGLCDKLPVLEGDKFGVNYIRPSIDRTWIYKADLTVTTDSFVRELSNDPLMLHYELATPIITEIDLDGYPYVYKDGHIFLNSEIAPTTTMKYSINQSHQIASQNGDLIRHEKEINYLYTLIAKYVNVQYESTLLNLDLELSRA